MELIFISEILISESFYVFETYHVMVLFGKRFGAVYACVLLLLLLLVGWLVGGGWWVGVGGLVGWLVSE